ncbi:MAG: hypothetical protein QMD04_09480, partial [Anaerolineales bacterium]|nr:hypothetical protein [Anaerolineales bacterium]
TVGQVHFIRKVSAEKKIELLNLDWDVPGTQPKQGVWATLQFTLQGAKLRIYAAAPDAPKRKCLAEHPFPLKEPVLPLREEFERPIPVERSLLSSSADPFRLTLKKQVMAWLSTMS